MTNLALAAQLRISQGDTTTLTTFRDGDNVDHDLTPRQLLSLWQQSTAYVSARYEASWTIKAMDLLPEHVTAVEKRRPLGGEGRRLESKYDGCLGTGPSRAANHLRLRMFPWPPKKSVDPKAGA